MAGKTKAATNGNGNGTPTTLTKREAVKQVLEQHGKDTMPTDICNFVKSEFGLDLTTAHASNIKSTLSKKKKGKGSVGKKGGHQSKASGKPQLQVAAKTSSPSRHGITSSEVAAIQVLIGQVGADELKRLVDVLDK